eukprot:8769170-Heterocapsa_arctica.AAC.1
MGDFEVMTLEQILAANLGNYKSFDECAEGADIEPARLEKEQFVQCIAEQIAMIEMNGGTVSRMAIIVKQKENGE